MEKDQKISEFQLKNKSLVFWQVLDLNTEHEFYIQGVPKNLTSFDM